MFVIEWMEYVFLSFLLKDLSFCMTWMNKPFAVGIRKPFKESESDTVMHTYLHLDKPHLLEQAHMARILEIALGRAQRGCRSG